MIIMLIQSMILFTMVMLAVGYFSLYERKVMSLIQTRKGPNKIIMVGVSQPLSDAIKLLTKQCPIPFSSSKMIYSIIPSILFSAISMAWITPWNYSIISSDIKILVMIVILSMTAYGPILSGWASNSKFSLIGSMRAIAQTLSFEIILSMTIITFCILTSSFNTQNNPFISYYGLVIPTSCIFLILAIMAESGRSPFDLPEGESELVSGYSVDYGGSLYKMIFLMENTSALFGGGILSSVCFPPFSWWKCMMFMFILVWIRATVPRVRYDKIMMFCWVYIMPIMISFILISSLSLYAQ